MLKCVAWVFNLQSSIWDASKRDKQQIACQHYTWPPFFYVLHFFCWYWFASVFKRKCWVFKYWPFGIKAEGFTAPVGWNGILEDKRDSSAPVLEAPLYLGCCPLLSGNLFIGICGFTFRKSVLAAADTVFSYDALLITPPFACISTPSANGSASPW